MKIQVILIALIVSFMSGHGQENPQVYCGRRLAQTVANVCQNNFLIKRSGYNSVHFGYEPEFGWPWLGAARARGLSGSRGKRDGQIVSECCEKPCSIDELLTYCN